MIGTVFPLSLPGLTRQSIFFAKRSFEADGPAGQAPRVTPENAQARSQYEREPL
jgi:hypothetical protein